MRYFSAVAFVTIAVSNLGTTAASGQPAESRPVASEPSVAVDLAAASQPAAPPLPLYERVGKGEPIVFLHGLGSDRHIWDPVVAELKKRYTCVTIDFRGHGETPPLTVAPRALALNQLQNDLRAVIDKEELGRVIIVAHELGGAVALGYARAFQNHTRMLILADTALQPTMPQEQIDAAIGQVDQDARAYAEKFMEARPASDAAAASRLRAQAAKTDLAWFATLFKESCRSRMTKVFEAIQVPVRLLYEQRSAPDVAADEYLGRLGYSGGKNFRSQRLEHVGVFMMLDDPTGFVKALSDCIAELPAPLQIDDHDWDVTASGIKYKDIHEGEGAKASAQARVRIEARAWHLDGDEMPLVPIRAEAAPILLTDPKRAGTGLREVVPGMKVGGERQMLVPPDFQREPPFVNTPSLGRPVLLKVKLAETSEPPALPEIDTAKQVALPSGVKYVELAPGGGAVATRTAAVKVTFCMWLPDGRFVPAGDASLDRQTRSLSLSAIPQQPRMHGIVDAVAGMRVGGKRLATIPAELAFGGESNAFVPPNSTIVIEIELLETIDTPEFELPSNDQLTDMEGGIKYKDIKVGEGEPVAPNATINMNTMGWRVEDDRHVEVENSYASGAPRHFVLTSKLPTWVEAVRTMRIGGQRIVVIPPKDAGEERGSSAPSALTQVFRIELIEAVNPPKFEPPRDAELTTTASGLKYKDIKVGDGEKPASNARVLIHYVGWLANGTQFDSSYDRGAPQEYTLGQGPPEGLTEGISSMRVGGRRVLVLSPELGFKDEPPKNSRIPPNATVIFDIELRGIVTPQSQP